MLDSRKIGAYISKLRKDKDLTQMELADQLNVSNQAVSKWERGESLPDIGTFPLLANFFGITIDRLLNAGELEEEQSLQNIGKIVEEIAGNRPEQVAEMNNAGEARVDEIVEVAPMVKASTLNQVTERLDRKVINFDLIHRLAPFLGRDNVDRLVQQAETGNLDWSTVQA